MAVYIIQEVPNRDYSAAEQFGEIRALLPHEDINANPFRIVLMLDDRLNGLTNQDYLLLTGDPIAIGVAASVAAKKTGGILNFLKWDRVAQIYHPVRVNLETIYE